MADPNTLFNNKNKIRRVDLDSELASDLSKGLLTETDRKKLDALSNEGGSSKLTNPLKINLNGQNFSYDTTEDVMIDITPETVGASKEDHNHDTEYSKLTHEHNYAGADEPGGAASYAKRLDHRVNIKLSGGVTGSTSTNLNDDIEIETIVGPHDHNYAGSTYPMGPANSATKLTNPIKVNITGAVTGEATTDGSSSVDINVEATHKHNTSDISDFPKSLPNAYKIILSKFGAKLGEYDGSSETNIEIPSSIFIGNNLDDFPEKGDSEKVYFNISNMMIYLWVNNKYRPVGLTTDNITVINGNAE